MAAVQLNAGETILKKKIVSVREPGSKWIYSGTVFLTNERFIIHKRNFWQQFFLGDVSLGTGPGTYRFEIPLTSIKRISGLIFGMTDLKTTSGQNYRLFIRFKAWLPILRDALLTHHQLEIVDTGKNTWVIQAPRE